MKSPHAPRRFALSNMTKEHPPRLPFKWLKAEVLGETYDLSFVIVGDRRSQTLNTRFRKQNKPANVLSFPLSRESGEMILNLKQARRDTRRFNMPYRTVVGYLFIHGLLHLKGYQHGRTMEKEESRWLNRLSLLYGTKHRSRNRRRNPSG